MDYGGGANRQGLSAWGSLEQPSRLGTRTSSTPSGYPNTTPGGSYPAADRAQSGGDLVPTFAAPLEGDWHRVALPAPPSGPLSEFDLLIEDPGTGYYLVPRDPAPPDALAPTPAPGPQVGPAPDLTPLFQETVRRAFARVAWPRIALQANPGQIGLVGLPTHFWATGYDGQPFGASESALVPADVGPDVPPGAYPADGPRRRDRTLTVMVAARPLRFVWGWGDGAAGLAGLSLGRPGPSRTAPDSDVVHQYEFTSLRSPGGFPVTLDATFGAGYTVDVDGARVDRDLGPVTIRFTRAYPVQQVQVVLVGR